MPNYSGRFMAPMLQPTKDELRAEIDELSALLAHERERRTRLEQKLKQLLIDEKIIDA
jgi:hypothetical protein